MQMVVFVPVLLMNQTPDELDDFLYDDGLVVVLLVEIFHFVE